MRTRLRLNLYLGLTFLLAFCTSSTLLWRSLMNSARDEVRTESLLRIEMAMAMRKYTIDEVQPLLGAAGMRYAPPAIPAHAAIRAMALLEQSHPQYRYREVALNPTNASNRAVDWQVGVIEALRREPALTELELVTQDAGEPVLHIARPVRPGPDCMACHGAPAVVAAEMLQRYGQAGTGWQVGEIVGAQIVSVPMGTALANARAAWWGHVAATILVFAALFAVLNRMLSRSIIAPIELRSSRWRDLACTDALTGAFNRRSFDEQAPAIAYDCAERGAPLAIVAMDIDHFKHVNDEFGHAVGDVVLAEVARRTLAAARGRDSLFRVGGEEFLLLLADTSGPDAVALAERVRAAIARAPFTEAGEVTASFGVAVARAGEDLATLTARADRALYAAKAAGRNRVEAAPA